MPRTGTDGLSYVSVRDDRDVPVYDIRVDRICTFSPLFERDGFRGFVDW